MSLEHGEAGGGCLEGRSLCAGDASGRALWVGRETWSQPTERIARQEVARELNAFRHALLCALTEADIAREAVLGCAADPAGDALALVDQHLHALCDAVWIADVESLVLTEHLCVRSAIHKVRIEAQRVAHLVNDAQARRRARRLAGVGHCVLAGLDTCAAPTLHPPGTGTVLLVSDDLYLADLLPAGPVRPVAVVCEAGCMDRELLIWLEARGMVTVELEAGPPVAFKNGDWLHVTAMEPGQEGRVREDWGRRDAVPL